MPLNYTISGAKGTRICYLVFLFNKVKLELVQGDITDIKVDAIVNAANTSLMGGGGVDGRIHEIAGPRLIEACKLLGGCDTGQAKITPGFNLPTKYIIHAVGPVWNGGKSNEEALLKSAYLSCLSIADSNGIRSIAFPNISTGIYRFPKEKAALIAIQTTKSYLEKSNIKKVVFVCFDESNYQIYRILLNSVKPGYF
ncbi:MAG TPA: O-acetyl-ADP-ribose deacetylase [Flavobacteriales bacterium]|nr:O-acetyl-ADP-ribose deacetylase [Flavobacteriales bacterium]